MITLEEVIDVFEDEFYPIDETLKQRMLNHPSPRAVLGKLAHMMDCMRC